MSESTNNKNVPRRTKLTVAKFFFKILLINNGGKTISYEYYSGVTGQIQS